MNNEQDKVDSTPEVGDDKDHDSHVERLESEVADIRAKLEKAGGEVVALRGKVRAASTALEAMQEQLHGVTSERDQALDRLGHLSAKLEEEKNARQLVEIKRDDLAAQLSAERNGHARTENARAAAQASADARGAAAAGLGLAAAVSLIAHAGRD